MPYVHLSVPQFRVNPKIRLLLDALSTDPYSKFLFVWLIFVILYLLIRFIQLKIDPYSWFQERKRKNSSGSTFQKLRSDSSARKSRLHHHKSCQNEIDKGSDDAVGSRCKPTVYGLRPQEVAGCISDSDDDESGLTQVELRKLQQTDAFAQWCVRKNMRNRDVQHEIEKVFVYKKLRRLHPESFWLLCRPDTLVSVDTVEPGKMELFCEYMSSRCIDIAVFALTLNYCPAYNGEKLTLLQIAGCTSVLYWFCLRHWIGARPSSGVLFSAYYETLGAAGVTFKSGPAVVVLSSILEDVFVIGTLGLGLVLSLHSRCFTSHAQSIAEKIFGIQLRIEKRTVLSN